MVNTFTFVKPVLHLLMRVVGLRAETVEMESGTVMNFWAPVQPGTKPAVVLVHGFAADGLLTWLSQMLALAHQYAVYVPDLLFFGGSFTAGAERSTAFQAECLAKGLRKLGVERCTVVGLSYGGMVGFKLAKLHPELVEALVASGTLVELTDSFSKAWLQKMGFSRWSDYLLPETAEGVRVLLSVATHSLPWLPHFFFKHFLEAMYSNRKERAEFLEALVVSDEDAVIPNFSQRIHLLWGEDDKIFSLDLAQEIKEQLGDKVTLSYIEKAGHLSQLERPFSYSHHLKRLLASLKADEKPR